MRGTAACVNILVSVPPHEVGRYAGLIEAELRSSLLWLMLLLVRKKSEKILKENHNQLQVIEPCDSSVGFSLSGEQTSSSTSPYHLDNHSFTSNNTIDEKHVLRRYRILQLNLRLFSYTISNA
jgi:hypothetical protein